MTKPACKDCRHWVAPTDKFLDVSWYEEMNKLRPPEYAKDINILEKRMQVCARAEVDGGTFELVLSEWGDLYTAPDFFCSEFDKK